MTGWAKIKKAAEYSGLSERTLRYYLKDGLKHSRLPSGTVLIKYEWIDEYLEAFAAKEDQVDRIVAETIRGIR
jgi:predicted site-specific integrase-resolvase